jgi:hypothetical protein
MDELTAIRGVEEAMFNSYSIIVGDITYEEMLRNSEREGIFFAHNIENDPTQNEIKHIKNYFEDVEDYEKCIELSKLIVGD